MADPFIGEIRIFAGNFAPRGWAFCDGQTLQIAQNTALFSLLGTTYGGDGRTTFGLPDLRGRAAMHPGTGPGLSSRRLGEVVSDVGEAPLVTSTTVDRGLAYSETTATGHFVPNTPQPTLAMHFIIALVGVFPTRS